MALPQPIPPSTLSTQDKPVEDAWASHVRSSTPPKVAQWAGRNQHTRNVCMTNTHSIFQVDICWEGRAQRETEEQFAWSHVFHRCHWNVLAWNEKSWRCPTKKGACQQRVLECTVGWSEGMLGWSNIEEKELIGRSLLCYCPSSKDHQEHTCSQINWVYYPSYRERTVQWEERTYYGIWAWLNLGEGRTKQELTLDGDNSMIISLNLICSKGRLKQQEARIGKEAVLFGEREGGAWYFVVAPCLNWGEIWPLWSSKETKPVGILTLNFRTVRK